MIDSGYKRDTSLYQHSLGFGHRKTSWAGAASCESEGRNRRIKCNQCFNQLIVEPTHFAKSSSSIIDLISTSNKSSILLSGVGDPFLVQSVHTHCPVCFVLSYHKALTPISTRQIWLYDRGNYQPFSRDLHETKWELLKDNDIDAFAKNIIDRITALIFFLAKQHIPNKTIKIRQSDPPWLTCEIKKK